MVIRKLFMVILCFCQIILVSGAFAQSPITANELIDRTPLKKHLKALESGEIVIVSRSDAEIDTELEVIISVLIPAPLNKTVDVLQSQSPGKDTPGVLFMQEITGKDSASELAGIFNKVTFGPSESDEVKQLMTIGPGNKYNLSKEEIAVFQRTAKGVKTGTTGDKAMAKAMGEVLKNRYLSYRKKGLKGVMPYQVSASEQASPAKELIAATESSVIYNKRKIPKLLSLPAILSGPEWIQFRSAIFFSKTTGRRPPNVCTQAFNHGYSARLCPDYRTAVLHEPLPEQLAGGHLMFAL
ncbi:MAG: hypothetical protein JRE29_14560 [Deltaproteobacteria bacterium]|nr:hypothetical protein [Deltaproteobacteria bacterium]